MTLPDCRFWVPGPLPGLNEIIKAAKGYGGKGLGYSLLKQQWTLAVAAHARRANLPKYERIKLACRWIERKRNRDIDNIEAGVKFIADGLKAAGVIPNDGQKHFVGTEHTHEVGIVPGVEVTVIDASAEEM